MIGHRTVGQKPHRVPQAGLGQQVDEGLEVGILVKDASAVVAAVQDVRADVGGGGPRGTRHGELAWADSGAELHRILPRTRPQFTMSPSASPPSASPIHYVP